MLVPSVQKRGMGEDLGVKTSLTYCIWALGTTRLQKVLQQGGVSVGVQITGLIALQKPPTDVEGA